MHSKRATVQCVLLSVCIFRPVFITDTITADIHQNLQAHQVNEVQYSQIKCGSLRLAGSLKPGHAVWQRDTAMLCQTNEFASVSRPDLILLHLIQIHVSAISETHCSLSYRETAYEWIHHDFCKTASDIHTRNAVLWFNDSFK